jgi:ferritin
MNDKIQETFNNQINAELYSSYLYLSMSSWLEAKNFKGFSSWMRVQAQEELSHALKFIDFVQERGGRVILTQLEGPKTEWSSLKEVYEDTYNHERHVTSLIHEMVDVAMSERDHAANNFLKWFVDEQVEEEASALEILEKLKLVGEDGAALFMIDGELGQRVFTPPAGE